jgi:hypothetical protein
LQAVLKAHDGAVFDPQADDAEAAAIAAGLHDGHAVDALLDPKRGVGVAADDEVQLGDGLGQRAVGVDAKVGERDHQVHLGGEALKLSAHGVYGLLHLDPLHHRARREVGEAFCGGADDGDLEPAGLQNHRRAQPRVGRAAGLGDDV